MIVIPTHLMGIALLVQQGKIAAIWRKVKVKGHVEEVKATIQDLAKAA